MVFQTKNGELCQVIQAMTGPYPYPQIPQEASEITTPEPPDKRRGGTPGILTGSEMLF